MKLYWLAVLCLVMIMAATMPGCSRQRGSVEKAKPRVVHDMNIVKPDKDSQPESTNEVP